jgi:hypothetical protein
MSQNTLPPAFDPSSHLSDLAKALRLSPLKGIFKYVLTNPNIYNLASGIFNPDPNGNPLPKLKHPAGIPNPGYFPFETLEGEALLPNTFLAANKRSPFNWIFNLFGLRNKGKTIRIRVPKYVEDPTDPNLAVGLQYGRVVYSTETIVHTHSRDESRHPGTRETCERLFAHSLSSCVSEFWHFCPSRQYCRVSLPVLYSIR